MKISVIVPCYNEEKGILATIQSCISQSEKLHEIIVVDDCSSDNTSEIIKKAEKKHSNIRGVYLKENTGLKSKALEKGLQIVSGEVFVTLDGDSQLDKDFVKHVKQAFEENTEVQAFSGFIVSKKHNLLTASRAFEYFLAQHIFKKAQDILGFIYVMPGCASAYRTEFFKENIIFRHDSLAEDLDITFRYHLSGKKVFYCTQAIVYTQDPQRIGCYLNQLRRWYGGGWHCIFKYFKDILEKPILMLIVSLMIFEGIFSMLMLILFMYYDIEKIGIALVLNTALMAIVGLSLAIAQKNVHLFYGCLVYPIVHFINIYVIFEQLFVQTFKGKRGLVWVKPQRY